LSRITPDRTCNYCLAATAHSFLRLMEIERAQRVTKATLLGEEPSPADHSEHLRCRAGPRMS